MTNETRQFIKKYFLAVFLVFAFAVLLVSLQLFANEPSEKALRASAANVLADWSDKPPEIGERVRFDSTGLFYTWTFETTQKGKKNGFVFIIPVTGNSGPYTGVFYYSPDNGTRFCGLAGISGTDATPDRYGITRRVIDSNIKQITDIVQRSEVMK